MSGVHPGLIAGGSVAVAGAAASKGAGALLPFTGVAFGVYLVLAVGLLIVGFALRRFAARREQ